jgi:hypothetical protein
VLVVHNGHLLSFVTDFASVNLYKEKNRISRHPRAGKVSRFKSLQSELTMEGMKMVENVDNAYVENKRPKRRNYSEKWNLEKKIWNKRWDDYFFFEHGKIMLPYQFPVVVCND